MKPNASNRDARMIDRRIRALSEPAASRALTPLTADAVQSAGSVDATGDFQHYGRVDIDRVEVFRAAP